MLHNESRRLLVKNFEEKHNAQETAEAFCVSKWTVYRLEEQMRKTGSVDLRVSQRGRKAKLSAADKVRIDEQIEMQPDITIKELKETLGLNACVETIRKTVIELGYRRKKKMIHASEQERPRCTGEASGVAGIRTKAAH